MRAVAHGLPSKRRLRVGPAAIASIDSGADAATPVVFPHRLPPHSSLRRVR